MTTLEYRFRWDQAEHRRFYHALRKQARSKLWIILDVWMALMGVISMLGLIGAWRGGTDARPLILPLVLSVYWLTFNRWGFAYMAARSYARDHAPCIPNDQVRILTPEGITARCTTSDVSVTWSGICGVAETRDFFLFMTTPACAVQLPKRAVGDLDQLRTWLREAAPSTALRLRA